jgi:hypothetical protein
MKNRARSTQAKQKTQSSKQSAKSLDAIELAQVHGGASISGDPIGPAAQGSIPVPGKEMNHNETLLRDGSKSRRRRGTQSGNPSRRMRTLAAAELQIIQGGAAQATPDFGGFKPGGPLVRTYGPIKND